MPAIAQVVQYVVVATMLAVLTTDAVYRAFYDDEVVLGGALIAATA